MGLNVKCKTRKLFRENSNEKYLGPGSRYRVLRLDPGTNNKLDLINQVNRQTTDWRKYMKTTCPSKN